jgi:hypothetical protein
LKKLLLLPRLLLTAKSLLLLHCYCYCYRYCYDATSSCTAAAEIAAAETAALPTLAAAAAAPAFTEQFADKQVNGNVSPADMAPVSMGLSVSDTPVQGSSESS